MIKKIFLLIILTLLFVRCSQVGSVTQLTGNKFDVISLMGKEIKSTDLAKGLPYLNFEEHGKLYGSTGCNNFTGSYELKDNSLKLIPGALTKMFCPGDIEPEFLSAINKVTNFKMDGNRLILLNGTNTLMTLISGSK